jgi:hypothetical protein
MDRKFSFAASGIAGILSSFLFLAATIAGVQVYAPSEQGAALMTPIAHS